MATEYLAYLRVRKLGTNEVVCDEGVTTVDVGKVGVKVIGLLIAMGDGYWVDESEVDAKRKELEREREMQGD